MRKILFSEKAIPLPNTTQMFQNTRAFIGAYLRARIPRSSREYIFIKKLLKYFNIILYQYILKET